MLDQGQHIQQEPSLSYWRESWHEEHCHRHLCMKVIMQQQTCYVTCQLSIII